MSLSSLPSSCILLIGRKVRNVTLEETWKWHVESLFSNWPTFFFFAEILKLQSKATANQQIRHFLSRCRWIERYMPAQLAPTWIHQPLLRLWGGSQSFLVLCTLHWDMGWAPICIQEVMFLNIKVSLIMWTCLSHFTSLDLSFSMCGRK